MLQIITAIMKDPEDPTICQLLFANQVSLLNGVLGLECPISDRLCPTRLRKTSC